MDEIALILGLLATVAALATAARRLRVPSPILMLIGGIAIGFTPGLLEHSQILQQLIATERAAAHELHGRVVISDDVLRRIERDLDLSELRASI